MFLEFIQSCLKKKFAWAPVWQAIRLEERSIRSFFDFIHKIRTKLQVLCALRNSEICGKDSNVAFQFAMLLQSDFTVDFFLELCGFFVHLKFLFSISQCSNKHVYTSGWVFLKSITVLNIEQTITWMCKSEENQINRYTFQQNPKLLTWEKSRITDQRHFWK